MLIGFSRVYQCTYKLRWDTCNPPMVRTLSNIHKTMYCKSPCNYLALTTATAMNPVSIISWRDPKRERRRSYSSAPKYNDLVKEQNITHKFQSGLHKPPENSYQTTLLHFELAYKFLIESDQKYGNARCFKKGCVKIQYRALITA